MQDVAAAYFFDGVPRVLVCLHDVVDQSKFRIIDLLQSAVSVGGFVCVASDCIALVRGHEWHDSVRSLG